MILLLFLASGLQHLILQSLEQNETWRSLAYFGRKLGARSLKTQYHKSLNQLRSVRIILRPTTKWTKKINHKKRQASDKERYALHLYLRIPISVRNLFVTRERNLVWLPQLVMFAAWARNRQVQQPKGERNFTVLPKHIQNQTQNLFFKIF